MALQRKLSALEMTVLGVVWKKGPCTAYAVMAEFANSAASFYRSGTGSIYPLLHRLDKAGIVSSASSGGSDKRYSLTEEGLDALKGWFQLGVDDDFSCALDVLRSRTYFLRVLDPAERQTFLNGAESGLKRLLAECEARREEYVRACDPFSTMAMEGTVLETRARIAWVRHCRRALDEVGDAATV